MFVTYVGLCRPLEWNQKGSVGDNVSLQVNKQAKNQSKKKIWRKRVFKGDPVDE